MKKIRHRFRLYLVRRGLKSATRKRRVNSYSDAVQIGLLCEATGETDVAFIRSLTDQLKSDLKNTTVVLYSGKKPLLSGLELPEQTYPVTEKDFSWLLKPKNEALATFAGMELDLLIDLTSTRAYGMKYLAAVSQAAYKTGAYNNDYNDIYDLLLQVDETCSVSDLYNHILHYLKMIKTK
ncbi:MAG: hypothetical protein RG741_03840 [Bacteroidales bacterium]|nr:hypothetical protein [Bacteroidales bacterium]